MAEEPTGEEKSLEMRVAELEDRLAQVHLSEEEIKAYQKVAGVIGQAAARPCWAEAAAAPPCIAAQQQAVPPCVAAPQAAPPCVAAPQAAPPCVAAQQPAQPITQIAQPIYRPITINRIVYTPIINNPIISNCWAECGPILPGIPGGGVGIPGQQFGQLGG